MSHHDPAAKSFVNVAPDSDFPIQNLPYGVFSTPDRPEPRVGVAIGDFILDMATLHAGGLLPRSGAANVFACDALNDFMALGPDAWSMTRARVQELLGADTPTLRDDPELREAALAARDSATLHPPFRVAAFSDFYSSKQHATNAGRIIRGEAATLAPNWTRMPIGYNSRASTVVSSGVPIRRPLGQIMRAGAAEPEFGPTEKLDIELEVGCVIGQDSRMGEMLDAESAERMIFGFVLLNDWSARDIQAWEYQPLGPFLSKAFATTISPWVVPKEALAPFRVAGPAQSPAPLAYLRQTEPRNYDIELEIWLKTPAMMEPTRLAQTNFGIMYWSPVQQLMHHASTGCAMRIGDLLGSGTVSGDEKNQRGSLLELSWGGSDPIHLPNGETRTFLRDGDSVALRACARGQGFRIGFGEAEGTIAPALSPPK